MNLFLLYLLLTKATLISFSGLASLPIIRHDFVESRHLLTDRQLNAAVAAGRTAPGPIGLYIVGAGYSIAGAPGAFVGCLAVMTPAFLILPVLQYAGSRAGRPEVRGAIECVTLAAAGLVAAAAVPLARDAITGPLPAVIAAGSFLFLVLTKKDTLWVILASAAIALMAYFL